MLRRPPRSTRTDTLFPYTTLFRSQIAVREVVIVREDRIGFGRVTHIFLDPEIGHPAIEMERRAHADGRQVGRAVAAGAHLIQRRSEEHTSELQSLMRNSYAVFCLKKKKHNTTTH